MLTADTSLRHYAIEMIAFGQADITPLILIVAPIARR
jgi:hypothetical protein